MSAQEIVLLVQVPDGWQLTGEYRPPKRMEHGIDQAGFHGEAEFDYRNTKWFILEPKGQ